MNCSLEVPNSLHSLTSESRHSRSAVDIYAVDIFFWPHEAYF